MLLNVLARQTLTDFEVVVVVDGDIDDTAGMLGRDYPHVQVIVFPENRGACGGPLGWLRCRSGRDSDPL